MAAISPTAAAKDARESSLPSSTGRLELSGQVERDGTDPTIGQGSQEGDEVFLAPGEPRNQQRQNRAAG